MTVGRVFKLTIFMGVNSKEIYRRAILSGIGKPDFPANSHTQKTR